MASNTRVYSLAEVAEHRVSNSWWIIIHGKVYDVTTFADVHPGGRAALTKLGGKDATSSFEAVGHSGSSKSMMNDFYIGDISESDKTALEAQSGAASTKTLPVYRLADVAKRNGPDEYWFVLNNMVLNVTAFGGDHPGGPEIIRYHSGTDATKAFKENGHSMQAVELSKKYIIGQLAPEDCVQQSTVATRQWNAPPAKKVPQENHETMFLVRQAVASLLFMLVLYFGWTALSR
jgi:cytochrome b5